MDSTVHLGVVHTIYGGLEIPKNKRTSFTYAKRDTHASTPHLGMFEDDVVHFPRILLQVDQPIAETIGRVILARVATVLTLRAFAAQGGRVRHWIRLQKTTTKSNGATEQRKNNTRKQNTLRYYSKSGASSVNYDILCN